MLQGRSELLLGRTRLSKEAMPRTRVNNFFYVLCPDDEISTGLRKGATHFVRRRGSWMVDFGGPRILGRTLMRNGELGFSPLYHDPESSVVHNCADCDHQIPSVYTPAAAEKCPTPTVKYRV